MFTLFLISVISKPCIVKKYFISLFLFSLFIGLQAQTIRIYKSDIIEERDGKQFYIHTVTQGQTAYSIAKAYNVSIDEIYFNNPEAKEGINIDDEIWIPTVNRETELNWAIKSTSFEFFYHITKTNQNFAQLAAIYHIDENKIRHANPGLFAPFREGEYVKIPVSESLTADSETDDVSFNPDLEVIPDYRHVVAVGETIYSISKKYNVSVSSLRAVNPTIRGSLEIGDRLRIPKESSVKVETIEEVIVDEKPQEPQLFKHNIRPKETLYSISRLYGVTLQELYAENPGLTENIVVGQVINVPQTSIDQPFIIYVADKKTKLKKLAKLYNMPEYLIQNENPSIGKRIYSGQRIRIPVGKKALEQLKEDTTEPEIVEVLVEELPKPVGCRKINPHYDELFNVALMVPLYLEETDSLDWAQFLSEKQNGFSPFRYIEFYEGALIAVDSMEKLGMQINLSVYDVDQTITKTTKVLQDPDLRNMDVIIGPFHSRSFDQVALFAGNFNIPIVNPLSYRDEVISKYPTVIKVKSDQKELIELVPRLIPEYYHDDKVFLITHTSYQDADLVTNLANQLSAVLKPEQRFSNNDLYNFAIAIANRDTTYKPEDPLPNYKIEEIEIYPDVIEEFLLDSTVFANNLISINYMKDSLHPFLDQASPLRNNLVILYGDSKAFLMDAMNRLNEHRDTFNIRLVGLPLVERFNNLDHTQANNMNLTYFSTTYIDYNSVSARWFIDQFRDRFKTEPGIYGYTGYDVTYYFLNALFNLDHRLTTCLEHVPLTLILSKYQFGKSEGASNYQNTYWNLIRYEGLSKKKLPDLESLE